MFRKTKVTTVKIKETNPKIYEERFNEAIKKRNYEQALKEIDEAINYSQDKERLECIKAKIDILYTLKRENSIITCIKNEISFFLSNMTDDKVIELIDKNVSSNKGKELLYKECINSIKNLKKFLIKLSAKNKNSISDNLRSYILEKIEEIIKCSQNNTERLEGIKSKIQILYNFKMEDDIISCIKREIPFFFRNMEENRVIELISKNVSSNKIRKSLYKECINNTKDLNKTLIELSKRDKDLISDILYFDMNRLIKEFGLLEYIKLVNSTHITSSQKLKIFEHSYKLNKFELPILLAMSYVNFEKSKQYLDKDLLNIVNKIGIDNFIDLFRQDSLFTAKDKINYLNTLLIKNKSNLNILDEIINYYNKDYDGAISYIDSLIYSLYKGYNKLSLIYLRKGIIYYNRNHLKNSKKIMKYALKLSKSEEISDVEKGYIYYNLSLVYTKFSTENELKIYLKKADFYYKKAIKLGCKEKNLVLEGYLKNNNKKITKIAVITCAILFFFIIIYNISNHNNEKNIVTTYNNDNSLASNSYVDNSSNTDNENSKDNEVSSTRDSDNKYNSNSFENVNTNRTEMYYAVYTEAFHNYEYAKDYVKELANKAIKSIIYKDGDFYKVRVGTAYTYEAAKDIENEINKKSISTYILAYDLKIQDEINNLISTYNNDGDIYSFDNKYEDIKSRIENKPGYDGYLKILNNIYNKVHSSN